MYRDEEQREFARTLRNQPRAPKSACGICFALKLRGHKFRRQAAIGPYIVDFVCFSLKLIVELDGPQHLETVAVEHDRRRTAWLSARGFRLIRFRNQDLDEDIQAVVDAIESAMENLNAAGANPPSPTLPAEGREPKRN